MININNWEGLRKTIKELFFSSRFITNPNDVYQSLIDIVNNIEKNHNLYLSSPEYLNKYLFENHQNTAEFWIGYLGEENVKLLVLNFIDNFGNILTSKDVVKMHENEVDSIKVKNNIFLVIELNKEKVKELNSQNMV